MSYLSPSWADQLTVMKIYEDVDSDDFLVKNYIWFKALSPEDDIEEDEEKPVDNKKEEEEEASLAYLRSQAAAFGACKQSKLLELQSELTRAATARLVARLEEERDEALDAVEFVTKKLLAVRSELERARSERARVEAACVDLSREHERVERSVERLTKDAATVEIMRKKTDAYLESQRESQYALDLVKRERNAALRDRDEARTEARRIEVQRDLEREEARRTAQVMEQQMTLLRNERDLAEKRLRQDDDEAARARDRLEAVVFNMRRELEDLRKKDPSRKSEKQLAEARADADNSRRIVERIASQLVAARNGGPTDDLFLTKEINRLSDDNKKIRRERDVLHAKICNLVYDDAHHSEKKHDLAAEFFKSAPGALAMIDLHDTGKQQHPTPTSHTSPSTPPSTRKTSPLKEDLSWTTSVSYTTTTRKDGNHDLPAWVKRIAPYYTKADFDNVRLRCIQFENEMAKAHHHPTTTDNKKS